MPKHASNEPRGASSGKNDFDSDERIGLTEAFPAVQPSDPKAGEDGRIGLTEAFAPVAAGEGAHAGGLSYQGEPRAGGGAAAAVRRRSRSRAQADPGSPR